jgi:DNA-binding MurR/RpiR family transcriptional regulator
MDQGETTRQPSAGHPANPLPASPLYDIVPRIAEILPQLRKAERKVAEIILADLAAAAGDSIGVLARRAGVSEASVTRFAKALGCRDVRALKLSLAQAAAVGQRFLAPDGGAAGVSATADRIHEDIVQTLEANRALMAQEDYARAAAVLAQAPMIYVFGMGGGSTAMADEARFRLMRLGYPVASYHDALLQRMVSAALGPRDAVLALSVTGHVPEMVENCRIAKEYGAPLVAITARGSPLAALADVLLPVRALETDFIFKPSSSRYALLMAVDVLATEMALLRQPRSREALRRLKFVLDTHRGGGDRQPLGD